MNTAVLPVLFFVAAFLYSDYNDDTKRRTLMALGILCLVFELWKI